MNTPQKLRARWAAISGVKFPAKPTPLPTTPPTPPQPQDTAPTLTTAEAQTLLGTTSINTTYRYLIKNDIPSVKDDSGKNHWNRRAVKKLAATLRPPDPTVWLTPAQAMQQYIGANNCSLWKAVDAKKLRTRKAKQYVYYHRADLARLFVARQDTPTYPSDWPDTATAASLLGCSTSTLTRLNQRGKLRRITTLSHNNKRTHLYHPADIAAILATGKHP